MAVLCAVKGPITTGKDKARAMSVAKGFIALRWDLLARTNATNALLVAIVPIKRQYHLCCVNAIIIASQVPLNKRSAHCYMNLTQEWRIASQELAFTSLSLGALA